MVKHRSACRQGVGRLVQGVSRFDVLRAIRRICAHLQETDQINGMTDQVNGMTYRH